MNDKDTKYLDTVEILRALGNPVRKAIVTSLASSHKPLKFSELMQASGLDPNFDTGHFGYHLSELMKRGVLAKKNHKYQLSKYGLKLSKILDTVQRERSSLLEEPKKESEEKMNEGFYSEFWQKHWLPSMVAGWSRAESVATSICRILSENGITEGKVLDLCCGTGRLSIWLAKKGFRTVGLDISTLYLEEATKKANEHGVESKVKLFLGDVREVDEVVRSESPFDCVISFRNSIGYWGDKTDEMIFTKARRITRKGGILIIGECDHLGQLMLNFDKRRVNEYENAIVTSEASMDYITNTFKSNIKYYTKEGDVLKYFDSFKYQVRMYSVCELASLLEKVGWKVYKAYENIETLQPFSHRAIFKGNKSMNIVAKAV